MEETEEWRMVEELFKMIDELETTEQQVFIRDLHEHLDPHSPFLEQQSEDQEKWLYVLYDFYCNDNRDAFEENY